MESKVALVETNQSLMPLAISEKQRSVCKNMQNDLGAAPSHIFTRIHSLLRFQLDPCLVDGPPDHNRPGSSSSSSLVTIVRFLLRSGAIVGAAQISKQNRLFML